MKKICCYSLIVLMLNCTSLAHADALPNEVQWICQQHQADSLFGMSVPAFASKYGSSGNTTIKWQLSGYTYKLWVDVYRPDSVRVVCRIADPNRKCTEVWITLGATVKDNISYFAYPNQGAVYSGNQNYSVCP